MTIQERQVIISGFAKEVLESVRKMERLGYKDIDIESVLEVVIQKNLKKFN